MLGIMDISAGNERIEHAECLVLVAPLVVLEVVLLLLGVRVTNTAAVGHRLHQEVRQAATAR